MADTVTQQLITDEAKLRGWQVEELGRQGVFCKITDQEGRVELFYGTRPLTSSANGFMICNHKDLTMQYVESRGYRVPAYSVIKQRRNEAEALEFFKTHRPIVAKPLDAQQGQGVTVNISSETQLGPALELAFKNGRWGKTILQEHLAGNLYRLFCVNGKIVAAARRAAGKDTDVTPKVHQSWREAAAELTGAIQLFVCGFDVICEDISKPIADNYLPLLEMNSSPGLKPHLPMNVAAVLLDEVFAIAKI